MVTNENHYDVIIIGAGIGGLTAGAFLAKFGQKVLILEQNDRPGGYVTSFDREGYTFDSSIAHLNELGENQSISQLMAYMGGAIPAQRMNLKLKYYLCGDQYVIDSRDLPAELIRYFPEQAKELQKFFRLAAKLVPNSGPESLPVFWRHLSAPFRWVNRMLNIIIHGIKPAKAVLLRLLKNQRLASIIWGFYPVDSINLISLAWGWEKLKSQDYFYPRGGMQAIPNEIARVFTEHGGHLRLKTKVQMILIENKRAVRVSCKQGTFYADKIIANSSIHHTIFELGANHVQFKSLVKKIAKRDLFVSCFAIYLGVDGGYDFDGVDYFFFLDENTMNLRESELSPENCPIMMMVSPISIVQKDYSVLVGAILPYSYMNYWRTGEHRKRSQEYYRLKDAAQQVILQRIFAKMGPDFEKAVHYSLAATPVTYERYTNNPGGAIMGWKIDKHNVGRFIPYESPVKNLYFAGQWVYPGAGVPAVMGSGYFVARKILLKKGIRI